jgi:hypothetical protein
VSDGESRIRQLRQIVAKKTQSRPYRSGRWRPFLNNAAGLSRAKEEMGEIGHADEKQQNIDGKILVAKP